MSIDINFNLEQYLCSVVEELRTRLPSMKVIKPYPTNDIEIKDLPVPAVLVDLYEILPCEDEEQDLGNGQLPIDLMMSAYVVIASNEKQANLKVRQYAIDVASVIHNGRKFDSPVSPAEILGITPQPEVNDDNHTYLAWGVSWQHTTYLGIQQTDELCDDPPVDAADIDKVFLGHDPEVGEEHKEDYEQVVPYE